MTRGEKAILAGLWVAAWTFVASLTFKANHCPPWLGVPFGVAWAVVLGPMILIYRRGRR